MKMLKSILVSVFCYSATITFSGAKVDSDNIRADLKRTIQYLIDNSAKIFESTQDKTLLNQFNTLWRKNLTDSEQLINFYTKSEDLNKIIVQLRYIINQTLSFNISCKVLLEKQKGKYTNILECYRGEIEILKEQLIQLEQKIDKIKPSFYKNKTFKIDFDESKKLLISIIDNWQQILNALTNNIYKQAHEDKDYKLRGELTGPIKLIDWIQRNKPVVGAEETAILSNKPTDLDILGIGENTKHLITIKPGEKSAFSLLRNIKNNLDKLLKFLDNTSFVPKYFSEKDREIAKNLVSEAYWREYNKEKTRMEKIKKANPKIEFYPNY